MDFKETFLKLTEYTIPFGEEEMIVPFIKEKVPNLQKDVIGNYYVEIGDSETLFTTHLDTYSKKVEKVNHIIEDDWIGTDGKTILGGDNKNGCTILLYLIEQNVPGTYYFFIGEEPILSGGLYGSSNILRQNPDFFKKFKRAIAFDRKKMGSVVIRQMARKCCSDEFADALIEEFGIQGLKFEKDPNAYYTDTATFLDVIPEITNLSAGGWGEHTLEEKSLITYIETVGKAAAKMNWEDLPVVRIPGKVSTIDKIKKFVYTKGNIPYKQLMKMTDSTFDNVHYIFDLFGYRCLNKEEFGPDVNMVYSHWHKDSEFNIKILGDEISINNKKIGKFSDLKKLFGLKFQNFVDLDEFVDKLENSGKIDFTRTEMDDILDMFYSDSNELIEYLNSKDNELMDVLEFNNNNFILVE